MRKRCIRTCTVPGFGRVEEGRVIDVPKGPWEKHFEGFDETPEPRAKKGGKKDTAPDPDEL